MAVAGRFMTKWEMVGGMGMRSSCVAGRVRGRGGCSEGDNEGVAVVVAGGFGDVFALMVSTAHSPFLEASRTESAAWWMKVRPSSQKGRTKGDTWW